MDNDIARRQWPNKMSRQLQCRGLVDRGERTKEPSILLPAALLLELGSLHPYLAEKKSSTEAVTIKILFTVRHHWTW